MIDIPVSRILCIQVSRIGDTLFATPALRAIAAEWPQAHMTVLGHPNRAEVFEHLDFVTDVSPITKGRAAWKGYLGSKSYDLAFVFGFDEPLVAYACRVAHRVVAFRQKSDALNRKLFLAVPPPSFQSEHAVLQLLRLPAALGIRPTGLRLSYSPHPDEIASARKTLEQTGAGSAMPRICLQVASFPTKAYRDWPIEYFADLCNRILNLWPSAHFLVIGGPEEKQRTHWLHEKLGSSSHLFAGTLTLRQTAALMSLSHLYIGVDTGPTHLMSTFDIPLIGLYHCLSSSAHTGPLDHPSAYLIDHPATGNQCSDRSSMDEISVDSVFSKVRQALGEHPTQ